jgi:hypothetical protein
MTYFQRVGLAALGSGLYFLSQGFNEHERCAGMQWMLFGLWLSLIGSAMLLSELLLES